MIRYVLQGLCGLMIAAATLAVVAEARRPAAAGFNASISPASSSASYQAPAQRGGGRGGVGAVTWDFETGNLSGWQATGAAFATQPTYGDNTSARKEPPANSQGLYWIGTFENYPGPGRGAPGGIQGDRPQGTLASAQFVIPASLSFRIGGGSSRATRVELQLIDQIDGANAVISASGKDRETMQEISWDLSMWAGRMGRILIVDASSGPWGHINVDDFRFGQKPLLGRSQLPGGRSQPPGGRGQPPGGRGGPPLMVDVPGLVGGSARDAAARLKNAGLRPGKIVTQPSRAPRDQVLSQNPEPPARAIPGSPVDFIIAVPIMVEVPRLIDRAQTDAAAALGRIELKVGEITTQQDRRPPGTVVLHKPEAGTSVEIGTTVDLVTAVPVMVAVPPLVGLTETEARQALTNLELVPGVVEFEESPTALGRVLRQSVEPMTDVAIGALIDFVVAMIETVEVPSVVGLSSSEARRRLTESRLVAAADQFRMVRGTTRGTVLEQDRQAGSRAPVGTAIVLTVMTPEIIEVPDVEGRSRTDAETEIRNAGLAIGSVSLRFSLQPGGTIVEQGVAPGVRVEFGTAVALGEARPRVVWMAPIAALVGLIAGVAAWRAKIKKPPVDSQQGLPDPVAALKLSVDAHADPGTVAVRSNQDRAVRHELRFQTRSDAGSQIVTADVSDIVVGERRASDNGAPTKETP